MIRDSRPGTGVVTRPTRMQGLLARWSTKPAAKFALAQAKAGELMRSGNRAQSEIEELAEAEYWDLDIEDTVYQKTLGGLHRILNFDLPIQFVDRDFLPNLDFGRFVVVVVVGQDGLVANTAKYVGDVPIVAVNPDPARFDGVLLPFQLSQVRAAVTRVLD